MARRDTDDTLQMTPTGHDSSHFVQFVQGAGTAVASAVVIWLQETANNFRAPKLSPGTLATWIGGPPNAALQSHLVKTWLALDYLDFHLRKLGSYHLDSLPWLQSFRSGLLPTVLEGTGTPSPLIEPPSHEASSWIPVAQTCTAVSPQARPHLRFQTMDSSPKL